MYCQCCGTDVYGDVCQACIDAIQAVKTIERFGGSGLIVSIVFGPCRQLGEKGDLYSVTVMDPTTGKEFEKPFGASCFGTIAEILDNEVPAMLAR